MELIDFDRLDRRLIERFESVGARHLGVARITGAGAVSVIDIDAGGVVGRHDAVVDQLFVVIGGDGWVSGADGHRLRINAGQAALWTAGESHESGTDEGMTALVVETTRVKPR